MTIATVGWCAWGTSRKACEAMTSGECALTALTLWLMNSQAPPASAPAATRRTTNVQRRILPISRNGPRLRPLYRVIGVKAVTGIDPFPLPSTRPMPRLRVVRIRKVAEWATSGGYPSPRRSEAPNRLLVQPLGDREQAICLLVDLDLLVRAAPATEQGLHLVELGLAAELASGRPRLLDERPDGLGRAPLRVCREVDQLRVQPVARSAPLVLGDERDLLDWQLLASVEHGCERRHQALHERSDSRDRLDACLCVADADFDGPKTRMGAEIPPDVRVVLERVALDPALDEQLELLVGGKGRRQTRARKGLEHLHPRRGEARWARLPEGRVGREREQLGKVGAQGVHARDCLLGRVESHMDVEAEDELSLRDPAHGLDQVEVPRPVGHLLVLVARKRVRAGRGDERIRLRRDVAQVGPQVAQIFKRFIDGRRNIGRHLDDRLKELRLDPLLFFTTLEGQED